MPKIKIIKIPPGGAPEFARKAWLNIEIPYDPKKQVKGRYTVDSKTAIQMISKGRNTKRATKFWKKLQGGPFGFPATVCEVIEK